MTSKDFTEWLNEAVGEENKGFGGYRLTFPLEMKDGTQLSIQASSTHYCSPRETTEIPNYNWYEDFEIGFPTRIIDKLLPYAEDQEKPTETVYGWVPKDLIREIIEECGGVEGVATYG